MLRTVVSDVERMAMGWVLSLIALLVSVCVQECMLPIETVEQVGGIRTYGFLTVVRCL